MAAGGGDAGERVGLDFLPVEAGAVRAPHVDRGDLAGEVAEHAEERGLSSTSHVGARRRGRRAGGAAAGADVGEERPSDRQQALADGAVGGAADDVGDGAELVAVDGAE
jgi:hypothetical protein